MEKLSLANPVFATYVIAASLMILKAVSMSWLTVLRMMREKGGFRSPEDIRKTSLNPEPNPKQLEPNERVERIREPAPHLERVDVIALGIHVAPPHVQADEQRAVDTLGQRGVAVAEP